MEGKRWEQQNLTAAAFETEVLPSVTLSSLLWRKQATSGSGLILKARHSNRILAKIAAISPEAAVEAQLLLSRAFQVLPSARLFNVLLEFLDLWATNWAVLHTRSCVTSFTRPSCTRCKCTQVLAGTCCKVCSQCKQSPPRCLCPHYAACQIGRNLWNPSAGFDR